MINTSRPPGLPCHPVDGPRQHVGHGRGNDRTVTHLGIEPELHDGPLFAQAADECLRRGQRNQRVGCALHHQDRRADRLSPGRVALEEIGPRRRHEHRGIDVVGQWPVTVGGGDAGMHSRVTRSTFSSAVGVRAGAAATWG